MSLRDSYRQDPPEQHWKNPALDNQGKEFCGHCGDDWPCQAVQRPRRVTGGQLLRREDLGRIVRETWVAWAREQPDPKPSWLTDWDDLDAGQREVDMRIGEAVAAALGSR
jgi:hypothetical protein